MFEELNDQLVRVKGDIRKKNIWTNQLSDYQKELADKNDIITKLKQQLSEEQIDVEKLEGFSVTNLFVTVLGKKEDRLDKEKQEVVEVQLKLEAANESKQDIEQAIAELKKKLTKVRGCEQDYQAILATKENLIIDQESRYSTKLYELSDQEADSQAYLSELEEAIQAGQAVLSALDPAIESLEKAKGWGTFDMLGGGAISSVVKHDHLNQAKSYINQAQSRMRRFQKELLDIDVSTSSIQINISDMLKFADIFFDGLISDWMVQGRINDSLEQAENQKYKMSRMIQDLKDQQRTNERKLEAVRTERKRLIETLS